MPPSFGPYRVLRSLGKGGFGEVFEVVHQETGVHYALKSIAAFQDPEDAQRFAREAQAMARLDHPNVARIYSADLDRPHPYLVQELLAGGDLSERVRAGPIPVDEALSLAQQLAAGLAAVHAEGILHRDLKPENVLLDANGVPKLVDFGLARLEDHTRLTETHSLLGTPAYMAPEQAQGVEVTPLADIYSLSALLYALLTGRPPFESRGNLISLLSAVVQETPQPPSQARPEVPPWLDDFVLRGLSKSPQDRLQSAEAFARALGSPSTQARRSPGRVWVAGFLGLAALGALVLWGARQPQPPARPSATPTPSPSAPASAPTPASSAALPEPRDAVVLSDWSDFPTSGWLFDDRSLIALDGQGRALSLDLSSRARRPLFQLPLTGSNPESNHKAHFHLERQPGGWFVGVQSFPIYRHDLTKPVWPYRLHRVLLEFEGELWFGSDEEAYDQELLRLGEAGLARVPLPAEPRSNGEDSAEHLFLPPRGPGFLVLTKTRLFRWTQAAGFKELEAPKTQVALKVGALSSDGKWIYLGTRGGVLVRAKFAALERDQGAWEPLPTEPGADWRLTPHKGSVSHLLIRGEHMFSVAHVAPRCEVVAWNTTRNERLQTLSFQERVGAVSLHVTPQAANSRSASARAGSA